MPSPEVLQKLKAWLPSGAQHLAKRLKPPLTGIGLDLGSTSLKAIQLSQGPEGLLLQQAVSLAFSPAWETLRQTDTIRQLLEKLDLTHAQVGIAVGGAHAVLRSVVFPKMSPKELKSSLQFEAEKYIPFKMDEVFLDSFILGDRPGGRMEVLVAAAKKELVNGPLGLLSSAGVTPSVVELEAVALANAWEVSCPVKEQRAVALLHAGARGTLINFFLKDQLQFTREIPIGGNAFTEALAQALALDASKAEAIKCDPGDQAAQVRSALESVWQEWLSQARVSFDFYENQFGQKVERLYLSGGSAVLAGFQEWIQQATDLAVELWNPLGVQGMKSQRQTADLVPGPSSWGVALGLALRQAA